MRLEAHRRAIHLVFTWSIACGPIVAAEVTAQDPCSRPPPGSAVPEPKDLRSKDGVLKIDLSIRNFREADGSTRYCYLLGDGAQSPTLRLYPGDLLVLKLKNDLADVESTGSASKQSHVPDPCTGGAMSPTATNLHFHGLTVPPLCHQDDVLKTSIQRGAPPFEYRFRIPVNEAPGLYWYHPHIHGFTTAQVLGGASGALIIEGIERANREVAGLPE